MHRKTVLCLLAFTLLLICYSDPRAGQGIPAFEVHLPSNQIARLYAFPDETEAAQLLPALSDFRTAHGAGWRVFRWNTTLGTPASIAGPAIPLVAPDATDEDIREAVETFISRNAALLKATPHEMRITDLVRIGDDRVHVIFGQYVDDLKVLFGRIDVSLWHGSVVMLGSEIYPDVSYDRSTSIDPETAIQRAHVGIPAHKSDMVAGAPRLVILPLERDRSTEYHLAWELFARTHMSSDLWQTYIDAHDGSILWRESTHRYYHLSGEVWGTVEENFGEPAERPLDDARLLAAGTYAGYTNEAGDYVIEVPENTYYEVVSTLSGLYCEVERYDAASAAITNIGAPGEAIDFWYNDANSHLAERNMYYHINVIHDWIKENDPDFTDLDYPVNVQVNAPYNCNAFWNGGALLFGEQGIDCNNPALISDLIYHEYGHAITDMIYAPHPPPTQSGMSEAFSDIYAICIHPDPLIGENFWLNGEPIRDADNLRQYPGTECGDSVHCLAEILMGAMWKTRKNLVEKYGEGTAGVFDPLHVNTVKTKQYTMPAYLTSLLVNNDDDGDLTNGTPDWDEICDAYAIHNLHCPELGSDVSDDPAQNRLVLSQNCPNPFSPMTMIRYELPAASDVRIEVFDVSGRLVRTLVDGRIDEPGGHHVKWDGTDEQGRAVGAGVFFYHLDAGAHSETCCMVLLR